MLERERITIFSKGTDPRLRYIIREIENWLKITFEVTDNPEGKYDLVYGESISPKDAIIPRVDRYTVRNVPVAEDLRYECDLTAKQFPFDIFSAIRFWLLDEANVFAPSYAFDVHERLIPMHSLQGRLDTITTPPVNRYVISFKRWLKKVIGSKTRWVHPEEKKAAIILSHDVDVIDKKFASYKASFREELLGKERAAQVHEGFAKNIRCLHRKCSIKRRL